MNWATLYITGRGDFSTEIQRKLDGSKLNFMPGYIDSSAVVGKYDLYWVDEKIPLREIKEAVGGKLIWKYRLRFFMNLEEFLQSVNNFSSSDQLTKEENELLTAMRKSA